jgi:hypothetical protein
MFFHVFLESFDVFLDGLLLLPMFSRILKQSHLFYRCVIPVMALPPVVLTLASVFVLASVLALASALDLALASSALALALAPSALVLVLALALDSTLALASSLALAHFPLSESRLRIYALCLFFFP